LAGAVSIDRPLDADVHREQYLGRKEAQRFKGFAVVDD
jgi:hypothetical protein